MSEENEVVEAEVATEPAPKKKGNKLKIIVPILAVIVIAGVGFWNWHNTPEFCSAICHTPMDPYNITYDQEPGTTGIDKWGNEVPNTSALMSVTHRVEGLACMDCHVPTLSEQIGEAVAWVTGNYSVVENDTYNVVLHEVPLSKLVEARGIPADEFCLNEGCHNVTREDLKGLTAQYTRNPHQMPHGQLECSDCHKAHRASLNQCSSCHADAPIPDGWLTAAQAKTLPQTA